MSNQDFINKSNNFVSNKMQELCNLYITERQKNNNELGCLILKFKENDVDVSFYPISSPDLSEDVKNDIVSKSKSNSNSNILMFITNEKTNFSYCLSKDLRN